MINLDTAITGALAQRPDAVPDERSFRAYIRALEDLLGPGWETEFPASTWARVRQAGVADSGVIALIGRQLPLAIRVTNIAVWPEPLDEWLRRHYYVVVEVPSWREPALSVDLGLLAESLGIGDLELLRRDLTAGPFSLARLWFVTD